MLDDKYFSFEEGTIDFPLYNENNLLTSKTGIGIIISVLLFILLLFGPVKFQDNQEQFILLFVTIIPLLFILNGNIGTFFRKPELKDLKLVILSFFGDLLYLFVLAFIAVTITSIFHVDLSFLSNHTSNISNNPDLLFIILEFIQIIAEELFRVFIFLIILHVLYKSIGNRKLSIIISTLISLAVFGLMHLNTYPQLIYCLLYIGFGSFFTMYPYLKTKNVLLSVLTHMLYNVFVLLIFAL